MGAAEAGAADRMRHLDDRPPEEEEVGKAVAGGAWDARKPCWIEAAGIETEEGTATEGEEGNALAGADTDGPPRAEDTTLEGTMMEGTGRSKS